MPKLLDSTAYKGKGQLAAVGDTKQRDKVAQRPVAEHVHDGSSTNDRLGGSTQLRPPATRIVAGDGEVTERGLDARGMPGITATEADGRCDVAERQEACEPAERALIAGVPHAIEAPWGDESHTLSFRQGSPDYRLSGRP